MTRRRNSGGYPRLPIAASCGGQQHDSSYRTPRKPGQTRVGHWISGGLRRLAYAGMVGLLEAPGVPPVDPTRRGGLDLLEGAPGACRARELRLVQPVDRLGEGVVVRVPRTWVAGQA
jgi:hypothetical protein